MKKPTLKKTQKETARRKDSSNDSNDISKEQANKTDGAVNRRVGPCCKDCVYPKQELGAHKCPLCKSHIHVLCCLEWDIQMHEDDEYLCKACDEKQNELIKDNMAPRTSSSIKKPTLKKKQKNDARSKDSSNDSNDISKARQNNQKEKEPAQTDDESNSKEPWHKKKEKKPTHKKITKEKEPAQTNTFEEPDGAAKSKAPAMFGIKRCTQDHVFLLEEGTRSWWRANAMEPCGVCNKDLGGNKYFYCGNTSCNFKKCEGCFKKDCKGEETTGKGRTKRTNSRYAEV